MKELERTGRKGPARSTALAAGIVVLTLGSSTAAQTSRISAGGIHIPTIMNFCGSEEIVIEATICNYGTDTRIWDVSFFDGGTPPAYSCTESTIPPHTFLDPVPVTVGAGQCEILHIRIQRPPELDSNANVCYWIQFDPDEGGTVGLGAQLIDSFVTCIDWRRFEEQVIFMHPLDPVILDPEVVNRSSKPIVFDYIAEVRNEENSPEQTVVGLNDEMPGRSIFGSIDLLPGESAPIPLVAEWVDPEAGGFFDVVIIADVPGGRAVGDLSSIGLSNADLVVVGIDEPDVAPDGPPRLSVSPNPWRAGRSLVVSADEEWTSLTIHDTAGRVVHRVAPGDAATSTVTWDGRDMTGRAVAAGAYFVRLESPRGTRVVKAVLLP